MIRPGTRGSLASGTVNALRLIHVSQLGDPAVRVAEDLDRHALQLADVARQLPPLHHALALRLMGDSRIYCFERNMRRWPDGLYHMVNRSYQPWRGHCIAFTREELETFGADEWDRRAIRCAHDSNFVPMEADCFHTRPRRQLKRYASIVAMIAEAGGARCRCR